MRNNLAGLSDNVGWIKDDNIETFRKARRHRTELGVFKGGVF